jgi:hypothetical protein
MKRLDATAGALLLALSLGILAKAELAFVRPSLWLSMDEGYASALALRLLHHGGLPYVEGVSLRGPVMYWVYELAMRVGGPFDVCPIRVAGFVLASGVVIGAWAAARAYGSHAGAGLAALLVVLHLTGLWHSYDGLALNAELIALPMVLAAIVLVLRASRLSGRDAFVCAGFAGALSAAATFAKQNFAVHVLVALAYLVVASQAPSRLRDGRVASFALGGLLASALVLAPYVVRGELGAFWYYFVRYGREVYLAPVRPRDVGHVFEVYFLVKGHLLILAVAAWLVVKRPAVVPPSSQLLLLLNPAVAVAATIFTGRYFGHYFLEYDVLACVALGVAFERLGAKSGLITLAALTPALATLTLVLQGRQRTRRMGFDDAFPAEVQEPVGTWVAAHTAPDDEIFVWGFRGEIHTSARRWPASRFVYAQYVSGVVPWYVEPLTVQMTRVVPGSHAQLLRDLEASRAPIIVDAGHSLFDRYMVDYPDFAAYLDQHYCAAAVVSGTPIYRRRMPSEVACDAPARRDVTP